MTRSPWRSTGLPLVALAALLAAGCAAPNDALPPPVAEMETAPVAMEPEESAPAPTSIAMLGLRGSSAPAPAGGMTIAAAGRASVDGAGSDAISISYPPTDESSLDALLTSLAQATPSAPVAAPVELEIVEAEVVEPAAEPEPIVAAAEPVPAAPVEPAVESEPEPFEMTALTVISPTYPLTPTEVAQDRTIEPKPAATTVADKPMAPQEAKPVAEPMTLAAYEAPAPHEPAAASPQTTVRPAPLPAPAGPPRLEDFYACDYAPARHVGAGVQLVACR